MERVRIFCHKSEDQTQEEINTWLTENDGKIKITRIFQSSAGTRHSAYTTITIFYTTEVSLA